jgi:hypothetical protein
MMSGTHFAREIMKKMGNRFGKKLALSFAAFGFVAASALVNAQEHISREYNDQTRLSALVHANIVKNQSALHDKLDLSVVQEPAWQAFVESMPMPSKPNRPDRITMEKLTTPERMEQQLTALREQEAKMTANLLALKTFYAALTPDQQKEFDDYHAKMARKAHLKPDMA